MAIAKRYSLTIVPRQSFHSYSKTITLASKFRIHLKICTITFRILKDNQPAYLADLLVRPKCSEYLRSPNSNKFVIPRIKTKTGSRAFSISCPAFYVSIHNAETILTFRKLLKS